jgi:hypothetical protein
MGDADEEERDLESLVFGSSSSMLANIDKLKKNKKSKSKINKKSDLDELNKSGKGIGDNIIDEERKPVWQDADDNEM